MIQAEQKKELAHPVTMKGGAYNTTVPTNAPEGQVTPPVAIPMPQDQMPPPPVQGDGFFTPVPPASSPGQPGGNGNSAPTP